MGKMVYDGWDDDERVLITRNEYRELLRSDAKLTALEMLGVDNWQGYDDAMDLFRDSQGEEKIG